MADEQPLTILCIASYFKGLDFIRECKRQGCNVILLTSKSLEGEEWPHDSIDQIFYIPDKEKTWNMDDVIHGVSFMARNSHFDKIVALDDFDVEKASALREHLRLPGMGDTTARYFRDKLAMRTRATEVGIAVPRFVHILNYDRIREFLQQIPPPYVLKPRMQAGAIGIKKLHSEQEVWDVIGQLGDRQSFYLLEHFVPGDIYHCDSILFKKSVMFSIVSRYGTPPMEVSHEGRVFSSRIVPRASDEAKSLRDLNAHVLHSLGLLEGVSHTEFIRGQDGCLYFLETSARVGGAHIVELVEAASGLNLWGEWAKIESLRPGGVYQLPPHKTEYAGLMVSLARQEWPDMSAYNDKEVVWRLKKKNHVGLVVASHSYDRVEELLAEYTKRFYDDFFAKQPPRERPGD